jgi:hypothetical protein
MSSTSFFIDAAEKGAKKYSGKSKQSAFSLVLSIAEPGKVSRSLKCDRMGRGGRGPASFAAFYAGFGRAELTS